MRTCLMTRSRAASIDFSPVIASIRYSAPRFEIIIMIAFLKSTFLPLPSVKTPSSNSWRKTLNTAGSAFSISSKRIALYGHCLTFSVVVLHRRGLDSFKQQRNVVKKYNWYESQQSVRKYPANSREREKKCIKPRRCSNET